MKSAKNEVIKGATYYNLTLTGNVSFVIQDCGRRMVVEAKCTCGVVKYYPFRYLKTGNTKSCGCQRRENLLKSKVTHNLSHHPLYSVYQDMQARCYNYKSLSYKNYGGRGIICIWENVTEFCKWGDANGYKKGLEIDRINNDGNYEPSNCRFVTRAINNTNTRRVIRLTAFGETKIISEWCRDSRCSISEKTLAYRLKNNYWSTEDAITQPANSNKIETSRLSKSARILEAFGESKSIIEWSEDIRCKVSYSGLKGRLKRGWSIEKSIS